jgi:hypothetical protein
MIIARGVFSEAEDCGPGKWTRGKGESRVEVDPRAFSGAAGAASTDDKRRREVRWRFSYLRIVAGPSRERATGSDDGRIPMLSSV